MQLSAEQSEALAALGLSEDGVARFDSGEDVVFFFPTHSEAGVGIVQKAEQRVRCGIVSIKDPGGGLLSLARFRANALRVARAFEVNDLELFGVAVVNQKLATLLQRQSFVRQVVSCPNELGGGSMEILSKVFPVQSDG